MPVQIESSLLTPAEVSQLLRISLSSVYAAAVTGRLPVVTLWRGRRKSLIRFKKRDIERMIEVGGSCIGKSSDSRKSTEPRR